MPLNTAPCIWIDLDNSPHVPFFRPIVPALRRLGFSFGANALDKSEATFEYIVALTH